MYCTCQYLSIDQKKFCYAHSSIPIDWSKKIHQYLSIDPKKKLPAHPNAHKPPKKIVNMNADIS